MSLGPLETDGKNGKVSARQAGASLEFRRRHLYPTYPMLRGFAYYL